MDEKPGDVLPIQELSAYLRIPKSTLYKLVREGKVPCQKIGRNWRFRKVAMGRWLEGLSAAPGAAQAGLVLLDNIEILFDVRLKQDPLRLLQGLSRNKTIVAAWNGSIVDGQITYAVRGHPKYRRYPIRDFLGASPKVEEP